MDLRVHSCLTDITLQGFKLLCVLNLVALIVVGLDKRTLWVHLVVCGNFGFFAMIVLRSLAPDLSFISPDALYSGSGVITAIIVFVIMRTTAMGLLITALLGFVGLGLMAGYAQDYALAYVKSLVGSRFDGVSGYIVMALLLVAVVVLFILYRRVKEVCLTLLYTLFVSLLFGVTIHTFALNASPFVSELCCDSADPKPECPIWLQPMDFGVVLATFVMRLLLYMYYKYLHLKPDQVASEERARSKKLIHLLEGEGLMPLLEKRKAEIERLKRLKV